jgi:plasmid stability protein
MSKMIQLRHVPDALHRRLKARAANAGLTLSEYLVREVRKIAERPSLEEMAERLRARAPVSLPEEPADSVKAERNARWPS